MAYTPLDTSKPDASTQAGTAFGASARSNLVALRDLLVALGMAQGFDYYPTGGTAEEPATIYFKRGTECVRVALTWSSGKVTKAIYKYASNETHASFPTSTNGTYEGMADAAGEYVLSITYDANDNVTAASWGSTE